jgi:integrase
MNTQKHASRKENLEWPFVKKWDKWGQESWCVDARTKEGGSRKFFKTKGEADTFAAQCRIMRGNQGIAAFGNAELAKFGKSVQWAIDFALAHLRAMEKSIGVEAAMNELIAARKGAGRGERYCNDLRLRLTRFAAAFSTATVATITAKEIDEWLASLNLAPGTRNTFRRDIRTLFSFCEKRGYCQGNEAKRTERATDIDKPACILTVPQASALLSACPDDVLPYAAISLFAGLRASEAQKLDWAEVDLAGGHIEVTAAKSKTARRRLVPISKNLAAWIKPLVQKAGPVAPVGLRKRFDAVKEAAKFTEWESNCLRHSFGSYRLAECQDAARVSLEMGNSPQMVFAHYRELVRPKEAAKFWKLWPASPKEAKKIIDFSKAA